MKNLKTKLVLMIASIAFVVSCGKKSDNGGTPATSPRDTRAAGPALFPSGNGSVATPTNLQLSGGQDAATENVRVLMSPVIQNSDEIKGVQKIEMLANVNYGADGTPTQDSAIRLVITDEYTNQKTEDGKTIPPIIVQLQNPTGNVKNPVNLVFSDNYGKIMVNGNWNGTTFTGTVSFQNNSQGYNGKNSGTLGTFTINTCSFFRCTN